MNSLCIYVCLEPLLEKTTIEKLSTLPKIDNDSLFTAAGDIKMRAKC